jgi:hypothetical protein
MYYYCYPDIINNTIAFNHASNLGGGLLVANYSSPIMKNNIFWGNTASDGPQIYNADASCEPEFYYSDIQGGCESIGGYLTFICDPKTVLDEDPSFEDLEDYVLSDNSPCIDGGDPDPVYYDPEDPNNPETPLWPAKGTLINDLGNYGGPYEPLIVGVPQFRVPGSRVQVEVYPNPTDDIFNLQFTVCYLQRISLKMFDLFGREVKTICDGNQPLGNHQMQVDVSDLPAGIYIVRLRAGEHMKATKIVRL